MSWTNLVYNVLYNEKKAVIAFLINSAALILIFNLLMDHITIAYPLLVSGTILFIYVIIKAFKLRAFSKNLNDAKTALSSDILPDDYTENMVYEAIGEMHRSYGEKLDRFQDQLNGRNTLFSQVIHNMKSSAAVIELACEYNDPKVLADIRLENEKLKKNLEQALNILRLDAFHGDYVPERVELSGLINTVINDMKRDFIYAGVYPKFTGAAAYVYTDQKWCAYIIGQLISNAIKYSRSGGNVFFELEEKEGCTELRIRDEGIGISPEDLPRVFDLFFTGENGRIHQEATGIGLAMVRHIARRLGHAVSIDSSPGTGTTVTISFLTKM